MRITIVSNRPPVVDLSARIDAADVVVRISKCDHLDTGMVGRRTDAVVLEPNELWASFPPEKRRMDLLRSTRVLVRPVWFPYWKSMWHAARFNLAKELPNAEAMDGVDPFALNRYSTQAVAVAWARKEWPAAELLLVGYSSGDAYQQYLHGTRWASGREWEWLDALPNVTFV